MADPILIEKFEKQPSEKFWFAIEFSGRLPAGLTISSAASAAVNNATNADAKATVIDGADPVVDGTIVKFKVKAGTHGVDYKITITATLSDGFSTLEEDVLMQVRNK